MEIFNNVISKENIFIFDLDGTLIETDEANLFAYNEAIQKIKKINLLSHYPKKMRFTSKELNQIFPMLHTQDYNEIISIKNAVYFKYLNMTLINRKLLNIINDFAKTNTIILATNSNKERADLILKYHNLENFFDYKFYNQDYTSDNKFKYILEYLKIDPNFVIVFENEKKEIELAKLAKIPENNIMYITKGE